MKFLFTIMIVTLSFSSFAQSNCATSLAQLRTLVGNPSLSTTWVERSPRSGGPVTVRISGASALSFSIEKAGEGLWMRGTGTICKTGSTSYRVNVGRGVTYGPKAPFGLNMVRSINLSLPYQSEMVVSAGGKSFTLTGR